MTLTEVAAYCAKSWAIGSDLEGTPIADPVAYLASEDGPQVPAEAWVTAAPTLAGVDLAPTSDDAYDPFEFDHPEAPGSAGIHLVGPDQVWVIGTAGMPPGRVLVHWRFEVQ